MINGIDKPLARRRYVEDLVVIAALLRNNEMLTHINLSDNDNLVDFDLQTQAYIFDGLALLGRALDTNITLRQIDMRNTRLCGKGYTAHGTKYTQLSNDGVAALAAGFARNVAGLQYFVCPGNCIAEEAKTIIGNELLQSTTSSTQFMHLDDWEIHPHTQSINLSKCHLASGDATLLGGLLKNNTVLVAADLSYNLFDAAGAKSIAHGLRFNSTLKTLKLGDNKIGHLGAKAIADSLQVNTTLEMLDLTGTSLPTMAAASIAEMLLKNRSLEKLVLAKNTLGARGAALLSEALKINESLQILDVSDNGMTVEGAVIMVGMLRENQTLRQLTVAKASLPILDLKGASGVAAINLSQQSLQAEDALIIARLLETNKCLRSLDLSMNNLGGWNFLRGINSKTVSAPHLDSLFIQLTTGHAQDPSGVIALTKALGVNKHLKKLKLRANWFDDVAKACIKGLPPSVELIE
jgi:Ran GTPase-activating protein (RanGAP) involved in mRNA processing and transport